MRKFLFAAFVAVFIACNTQQETNNTALKDSSSSIPVQEPVTGCYSNMSDKDTVLLKLEEFPNVVTGNLTYKLFEKDANNGSIYGKLYGDTLIADYTFLSEGKKSVRQIAFLIKDNTAIEGYGEMMEQDGKMLFRNVKEINFSNGIILNKTPCPVE